MNGLEPSKSKNLLAHCVFHGRGVGCDVLCCVLVIGRSGTLLFNWVLHI